MGKSKSAFTGFRSLQIAMLYTKLIQIENYESTQTTYPRGAWSGFSPRLEKTQKKVKKNGFLKKRL